MAENKENMKKQEGTRQRTGNKEERIPLRTLSYHTNVENCLAGPSRATDTRFVTYRTNNYEELDWDLAVFKDSRTDSVTRKDCNNEKTEEEKTNQKGCDKTTTVTGHSLQNTPLVTPNVETDTTKKVKRSLKRPLARLQRTDSPTSSKSGQFSIYSHNDIKPPIFLPGECIDPLNEAYLTDNLNYLLQTEKRVLGEPKIRNASRSCVVNWIVNVNGSSGNPAVVQLACWYLDTYLSTCFVTVTKLQVIAAACFWIATKFHGRLISGKRLVRYSAYAFIEKELVATERNILRKLRFQALSVAPHDYVPYLSWCCDQSGTGIVEVAAVFLCQCGIMVDKTLSEEYPSVVAAAAVENALVLLRMNETSMEKLKSNALYKAVEKKAVNLNATCAQLLDAVRVVSSIGYEYKAPLFKFSGPPHHIANKLIKAVHHHQDVPIRQSSSQMF